MLFLSRYIGENAYAVVDTDDYSETVVDYEMLMRARAVGVVIQGVEWLDGRLMGLKSIQVWPGLRPKTPDAVKLRTLLDVDLRVYKNIITQLNWGSKDVTLRLSKYGQVCGDRFLYMPSASESKPVGHMTLIVDDNIMIGHDSFHMSYMTYAGLYEAQLTVNLFELHNDGVALMIYSSLKTFILVVQGKCHIDIADRRDRYERYMKASDI